MKWSMEENKIIKNMLENKHTYKEIAKKFNVSLNQIKCHVYYMRKNDLTNRKNKIWTNEEIEILENNVGKLSIKSIQKLIPTRSKSAIYDKMQKLKISNTKNHVYGLTIHELAKIIKIDDKSIKKWIIKGLLKAKIRKTLFDGKFTFIKISNFWIFAKENKELLNFKNIERKVLIPEPKWFVDEIKTEKKTTRYKKKWTNKEDKELQKLFNQKLSYLEIAKRMNRNYSAITHRLNRICLNTHYKNKWTDTDINILIEQVNKNINRKIIAKNLNRSYFAIITKTKELKNNNKWQKIKNYKKWYKLM